MSNPKLQLKNVGQIHEADIEFGDLTVLVGPQATGKSIFLQFLRLLVDTGYVIDELRKHGLVWNKDIGHFLDIYLGEGMRDVWHIGDNRSAIIYNGDPIDLSTVIQRRRRTKTESLFFIPAQRVLTLGRGWPRPFSDYGASDPFSVRDFSEKIRLLMETGWGRAEGGEIFPQTRRLKKELRKILDRTVFHGFGLRVDTYGSQKRLVLKAKGTESTLPFMVWSAGQREFVPLLMGFYWLLPPTKVSRRQDVEWVVIEEPEAGLHPNAISAVLLLILDLLARGYRVCLSTHSPHVLDVVWALRVIREHQAPSIKILDLFNTRKTDPMKEMADAVLGKIARVYYFDQRTGRTHDISGLDPGSKEASEAGWGGLSEFSGHVADVVAKVVNARG
jgi:energy-coupling factor transporter ATP-binding protein EcfA2